ncbi:MAG: S8 family serine peptidase [Prolixibacteraceae bacterium]
MRKFYLFTAVCLFGLMLADCTQKESILSEPTSVGENSEVLKSASMNNKYIVVLNADADISNSDLESRTVKVKGKALGLLKKYGVTDEVEEVYETALQGFAVKMAPGQAKKMESDSDVRYIEADQDMFISQDFKTKAKPGGTTPPPAQSIPWGITRVGGGITTSSHTAWVIDTGIDFTHPDLNVDVSRSATFVSRTSSADDENGHGSHVAGTIAAINNSIGVVGVAPGTTLVAVRVLDRRGSGTTSGVIAGVNYVAANGVAGDVANMSLGGGVSTALDDAVLGASSVVKFALAAGNESDDANNHSPARVNGPNIYTVSAMANGDLWASFSNYSNPPVDFCAPGVSVYSTYKDGGYSTLSGTSMATPHVAGLLLLGSIKTSGYVIGDPDGNPDPIAHN